MVMVYLRKFLKHLKDKGLYATFKLVFRVLAKKVNVKRKLQTKKSSESITDFIRLINGKRIIIFYHVSGWGGALKQRPHHIATELTKRGYEYVYPQESFFTVGDTPVLKNEQGVNIVANLIPFLKFEKYKMKPVLHLWSTNYMLSVEFLEKYQEKFDIFYEFVDEIDASITGSVGKKYLDAHNWLLKNKSVPVVCTANKLIEEAVKKRGLDINIHLASNGVFMDDFDTTLADLRKTSEQFRSAVTSGKKIIGYYGALASWVDFDLLKKVAKSLNDCVLVLIGNDYDGSFKKSGLSGVPNVLNIPPVNYFNLKDYGKHFDVGLIPFKVNEVTESTSPVKLFEYMAMKLPIVSSDIRECRMYKSVLTAKTHEDFVNQIRTAIAKSNDNNYLETLYIEAGENSWDKKADIVEKAMEVFK